MTLFSGIILALVALSLILITLSLRWLRTTTTGETYTSPARFFLIVLRVAIGWHCFVEGMDKISTPNWSSEGYLREATGPLSGIYRGMADDRLLAKVTVEDDSFPPELEREWRAYFNAFIAYYDLTDEQVERAQGIFDQRKKDTLSFLLSKSEPIVKASAFPPELKIDMTMKQRLAEHDRLVGRIAAVEANFPTTDKAVHAEWRGAKADLAKFRADLKKTIDAETAKLKGTDKAESDRIKKFIAAENAKLTKIDDPDEITKIKKAIAVESAKRIPALDDVLTSEQKQQGPMPAPEGMPIESWRLLEIADFVVKYGLVALGAMLMLGLFSRASSLAMAILLLSFYAAMPPLPGWPESPRSEGHYVLVNKTLIEVIALMALTFIPTGRWAGLDVLLGVWRCRAKKPTT